MIFAASLTETRSQPPFDRLRVIAR